MPNHVKNKLVFKGNSEEIEKLRNAIRSEPDEKGKIYDMDFNKIIPMPETMMDSQPHMGIIDDAKFALKMKKIERMSGNLISDFMNGVDAKHWIEGDGPLSYSDSDKREYLRCIENGLSHGYVYWRDWAIDKWGTKWNAYEQDHEENTDTCIFYSTAWSPSISIVQKLSDMFPTLQINLAYADEDSGSNVGVFEFLAGECIEKYQPENGSNEAYEICLDLHPEQREYIKLVGGKYEYIDED